MYQRERVLPPFDTQRVSLPELGWPHTEQAAGTTQLLGWNWGQPLLAPSRLRNRLWNRFVLWGMRYPGVWGTRACGSQGRELRGHAELGQGSLGQATVATEQPGQQLNGLLFSGSRAAGCSKGCSHPAVCSESELHERYCALSALAAQQESGGEPCPATGKADTTGTRG